MLYRSILALICLAVPQEGTAGPWLREKGSSFTAVSFASTYYLETASQTYIEYGLTDKMTVVADISMARLHNMPNSGYATLSLRRALGAADDKSKWAYELGLGTGWIGEQMLPHVRTALSWGRGMTWREKSGWITVEGAVVWDVTYALHIAKVDTTVGLNLTDNTKGMLQLYAMHAAGESIATLAPSVVFSPESTKFSIQIGTESQLGHLDNSAVKIGIWREF